MGYDEDTMDNVKINSLIMEGHTEHCACRQVWGDGECECKKRGIIPGSLSRAIVNGEDLSKIKKITIDKNYL